MLPLGSSEKRVIESKRERRKGRRSSRKERLCDGGKKRRDRYAVSQRRRQVIRQIGRQIGD